MKANTQHEEEPEHAAYFAHREQSRSIEPRHCDVPITFERPSRSQLLPKSAGGHILRPSLAPLTNKVSQVEMEAGDCEGRLPPLFLHGLRPWFSVLGLGSLIFSKE